MRIFFGVNSLLIMSVIFHIIAQYESSRGFLHTSSKSLFLCSRIFTKTATPEYTIEPVFSYDIITGQYVHSIRLKPWFWHYRKLTMQSCYSPNSTILCALADQALYWNIFNKLLSDSLGKAIEKCKFLINFFSLKIL